MNFKRILLLCPLLASAYGGGVVVDPVEINNFKNGAAQPEDLRLLYTPETFSHHPLDFFRDLPAEKMKALMRYFVNGGKLAEFISKLQSEDIDYIASRTQPDYVNCLAPLFNTLSAPLMRFIRPMHLTRLSRANRADLELGYLNPSRIALVPTQILRQTSWSILENHGEYTAHVSLEAFKAIIDDGRCDLLEREDFGNLSVEKARLLDSNCIRILSTGAELNLPPQMVPMMQDNAFSTSNSRNLPTALYTTMTVKQLLPHLSQTTPDASKMARIPPQTLKKVLETLKGTQQGCQSIQPELVVNLPVTIFPTLDRGFWSCLDHRKNWIIQSSQLVKLPEKAFSSIHPLILHNLQIIVINDRDRENERVGALLRNLGVEDRDDGRHSCEMPNKFIKFLKPFMLKHLLPNCARRFHVSSARLLRSPAHLNALHTSTIAALTANHISNIPTKAFSGPISPFIQHLSGISTSVDGVDKNMDLVPCAGLWEDQLAEIRTPAIWRLFSSQCILSWRNITLISISDDYFHHLQARFFKRLYLLEDDESATSRETMHAIFTKIGPGQMENLAVDFGGDIEQHPCYELDLPWAEIGGPRHASVIGKMVPSCFALLKEEVYGGMEEGAISRMPDDIFRLFTDPDRLAAIPGGALRRIRDEQMAHMKPAIFAGLTPSHVDALAMDRKTGLIMPDSWENVPLDTLKYAISSRARTDPYILTSLNVEMLQDTKWIGEYGDHLSVRQWNGLATETSLGGIGGTFTPCENVKYDDVELATGKNDCVNFWKGMNASCMASLRQLESLTMKELQWVPDTAFAKLNSTQRATLAKTLGEDRKWRLDVGREGCTKYSLQ